MLKLNKYYKFYFILNKYYKCYKLLFCFTLLLQEIWFISDFKIWKALSVRTKGK